jgi:hypothetical protein|tara:strand:+ start:94 stop:375 length:282 start_codon:yes stop_codon:yes gene_type:complete
MLNDIFFSPSKAHLYISDTEWEQEILALQPPKPPSPYIPHKRNKDNKIDKKQNAVHRRSLLDSQHLPEAFAYETQRYQMVIDVNNISTTSITR